MTQNVIFSSVFLAGLISFFSPCILPLLPVYFGILTNRTADKTEIKEKQTQTGLFRNLFTTLAFILGLATNFMILGFGAGALSAFFSHRAFTVIGGFLMIFFGLIQLEIIKINLLFPQLSTDSGAFGENRFIRAFVLGFLLSLGWTPCIGPVFASVLVLAAQTGTALRGALFMAVYTLGLAIPFLLIALFSDILLNKFKSLNRWSSLFKKLGGVFLIVIGILLMTNRLMF